MDKDLVYFHGINGCFNHNIEMLRDAAEVIGLDKMVNAYDSLSFGIKDGGRLVIMINNRRAYNRNNNIICVEFQGDGVMTIYQTDSYGNKVNSKYELFDTHAGYCHINGKYAPNEAFKKILKNKFDITY